MTSGPALDKKMDVMPYLTNAAEGSILFIDEIHRLPKTVEEFIYPVMEDFRVDVVLGEGMSARTINLPLKKFTIIGATTRSGMLSGPLRDRFHMHEHLEFYDVDDLARIVSVNASKLRTTITPEAAWELAGRSRGTPRLANARLRWVRDYATARADGHITLPIARDALDMQEIDAEGMDKQDRRYLETLIQRLPRRPDRRRGAGRHDERRGRHPDATRSSPTSSAAISSSAPPAAARHPRPPTATSACPSRCPSPSSLRRSAAAALRLRRRSIALVAAGPLAPLTPPCEGGEMGKACIACGGPLAPPTPPCEEEGNGKGVAQDLFPPCKGGGRGGGLVLTHHSSSSQPKNRPGSHRLDIKPPQNPP